jgi:UDP-glucose 4-epimerase
VADLADAHVVALKKLMTTGALGPINLGTGRGYSVKEIVTEVERITGHTIPLVPGDPRPGDPPVLVADPKSARQVLGVQPSHSDLATIIESAWRWHQKAHPRIL